MPRQQQPRDHDQFSELAAGYALYALDIDERRRFETHLADCPRCAEEVAAHEHTAAVAFAADEEPPAGLREAILDNATGASGSGAEVRTLRPRRVAAPWLVSAAASVAVIALAMTNVSLRDDVSTARVALERTSLVVQCAATPTCRTVPLADSAQRAFGVAVVDASRVTLVVNQLPKNDRSRETYVLWQTTPGRPALALRAFDVRSEVVTALDTVALVGSPSAATSFAVSIEPGRRAPAAPTRPVLTPVT